MSTLIAAAIYWRWLYNFCLLTWTRSIPSFEILVLHLLQPGLRIRIGDDPDPDPTPEKNLIHDPTLEIKTGPGNDLMKFIPNDKKLLKKVCIF